MDCPETFRLKDRFEEGGSRVWIFLSSMWLFSDTGAVAFYCNRVQRKTTAIRMSSTYDEGQETIWGIVSPTIGLRRLFITESQNLTPSLLVIHRPRTARSPLGVTPGAT